MSVFAVVGDVLSFLLGLAVGFAVLAYLIEYGPE